MNIITITKDNFEAEVLESKSRYSSISGLHGVDRAGCRVLCWMRSQRRQMP